MENMQKLPRTQARTLLPFAFCMLSGLASCPSRAPRRFCRCPPLGSSNVANSHTAAAHSRQQCAPGSSNVGGPQAATAGGELGPEQSHAQRQSPRSDSQPAVPNYCDSIQPAPAHVATAAAASSASTGAFRISVQLRRKQQPAGLPHLPPWRRTHAHIHANSAPQHNSRITHPRPQCVWQLLALCKRVGTAESEAFYACTEQPSVPFDASTTVA